MNRICVDTGCRLEERLDLEIALAGLRRSDAERAVCQARRNGISIGLGDREYRFDTELPARPDDTDGDFASVGNQDAP
jgi:hypothetical protein